MRGGWLRDRGLRGWERVAVVTSVTVLSLLTWQVSIGGGVVGVDHWLYGRVGAVASTLVTVLADLGSPELSGVVVGVAALHQAFFSGRWWPLVLAAGNGLVAAAAVLAIKAATARPGPGVPVLDGYPGYFPSGHTVSAAVCFGTAGYIVATSRRLRGSPRSAASPPLDASEVGVVAGLAAGFAVGTATVLLGTHWASDVAAGLALAVVVLVVGFATVRRHLAGEHVSVGRRTLKT